MLKSLLVPQKFMSTWDLRMQPHLEKRVFANVIIKDFKMTLSWVGALTDSHPINGVLIKRGNGGRDGWLAATIDGGMGRIICQGFQREPTLPTI